MRRRLILAGCLLAAAAAYAEPLAIKGLALGADLKAAAGPLKLDCYESKERPTTCNAQNSLGNLPPDFRTIAGVRTKGLTVSADDAGQIGQVRLTFLPGEFPTVRDVFKERYPSLACTDSTVKNRAGAEFSQTECSFTNDDGSSLKLRRRAYAVDESDVEISSTAYAEAMKHAAERRKAAGKGDI